MRRRQTVSFAVTAAGPAPRVRALLERVRPYVDEIVLAIDRRSDLEALETCGDLADRRITFELRHSPARLVGWILDQCTGDWMLRLDDDEVPSEALLTALPDLTAERHPLAFHVRRHWIHPTAERYIATRPWSVDFQEARLVRNLPGAWTFDGSVHTVGTVEGEQRFVDLPIYHCDLVCSSLAARRSKRVRYESEWPGVVLGGARANDMYVPEEAGPLEHAPVPPADLSAVRALLQASATRASERPRAPVENARFEAIDRFNLRRAPARDGFAASVALEDAPGRVGAECIHHVFVAVANTGTEPWLWVPRPDPVASRVPSTDPGWAPVRVQWSWRPRFGAGREHRGWECLSEAVWPGETSRVPVDLRTPAEPGEWELEVGVERGGSEFGHVAQRVRVDAAPVPEPSAEAVAGLAALRHRLLREQERTRKAEREASALLGLRRYRVGAWITRGNGMNEDPGR